MAQRLIRTLCQACKTPLEVSQDDCERLGYDPDVFKGRMVYDAKGCVDCHQLGYQAGWRSPNFSP